MKEEEEPGPEWDRYSQSVEQAQGREVFLIPRRDGLCPRD